MTEHRKDKPAVNDGNYKKWTKCCQRMRRRGGNAVRHGKRIKKNSKQGTICCNGVGGKRHPLQETCSDIYIK